MEILELNTMKEGIFDESASHPLQAFSWGTIREKTGLKVVRFGVYENDILKETYQMTLHKIPFVNYFIGYIPRSRMPSREFLKYLKEYGKKYNIVSVMFEPDEIEGADVTDGLRNSNTPLFYKWTRVINLSRPIEDLKKEFDATTRYNIGLAERKGVTVTLEDSEKGFEDFYSIYEATTKRQHFGGHTRTYHKTIWDIFSRKGIAHILVARLGGQALATCELWLFKGTLYYTYAGSSLEHRNLKAMNALMWHVIKFGSEHGATKLDLWGILPPNTNDPKNPWAGFTDFKTGFGGEAVAMIGSYDFVISPSWYWVYVIGYKLRKCW